MPWDVIYVIFSFALIATGMVLVVHGYPYVVNQIHEKIPAMVQDIFFDKMKTWFTITVSTTDVYAANNPLDVQIKTGTINLDEIREIQIQFLGAQKAVLSKEPVLPDSPLPNASSVEMNQYQTAMQKYSDDLRKYYDEYRDAMSSNVIFLNSVQNYEKLVERDQQINAFIGNNMSLPKYSQFAGSIQNLTYPIGGTFDLGITLKLRNGSVVGYGMTDLSYAIKDAITVSPPEVMKQVESNEIMTGLGYIGIEIAPLVAGLVGILEILKHFAFP